MKSAYEPKTERFIADRYTKAERQLKIQRYLEKRERWKRSYVKGSKYECRSIFARNRPRVGGRFLPKSMCPPMPKSRHPQMSGLEAES